MSKNVTYQSFLIKAPLTNCTDFYRLYSIFKDTLKPGMRFIEFRAYYASETLEYIDTTLVLKDNKVVGFCAAAFYSITAGNRQYTIGRAATGVLPDYRGNTLPKWMLYKKYMRYWFANPLKKLVITAYVANPLIYAMICKYTGIAYPRRSVTPPPSVLTLKEHLLETQRLQKSETSPFVMRIHFCVEISDAENERIVTSKDANVLHYLILNPNYRRQFGVMVIIPVTLHNILLSICRFLHHKTINLFSSLKKNGAAMNKPANLRILPVEYRKK